VTHTTVLWNWWIVKGSSYRRLRGDNAKKVWGCFWKRNLIFQQTTTHLFVSVLGPATASGLVCVMCDREVFVEPLFFGISRFAFFLDVMVSNAQFAAAARCWSTRKIRTNSRFIFHTSCVGDSTHAAGGTYDGKEGDIKQAHRFSVQTQSKRLGAAPKTGRG